MARAAKWIERETDPREWSEEERAFRRAAQAVELERPNAGECEGDPQRTTMICPFFRYDYGKWFTCEGGRLGFDDPPLTRAYYMRYCASFDYRDCSLARTLERWYEAEQDA